MKKQNRQLTLLLPALLHDERLWSSLTGDVRPLMDNLERFFARANREQQPADNFSLLGLDLPVAEAACSYAWDNAPTREWCLRIDPVHLEPGRQGLILSDSTSLNLSQSEALAMVEGINRFLAEDGLQIEAPAAHRWYLRSDSPMAIKTHALPEVVGKNIDPYLPQGEQALHWHRLMNELQMFLHTHEVNQQREARGLLPVNSLWLWGEGALDKITPQPWQQVWSDDAVTLGLATYQQLDAQLLGQQTAHELLNHLPAGQTLIELAPSTGKAEVNPESWLEWLVGLEENWLQPLLDALQQGELAQLTLIPDNQQSLTLARSNLRRWWRRTRPIERYRQP